MVELLEAAARTTQDEDLRLWFKVTALNLKVNREVRNLDEVMLAAERELK